VCGCIYYYGCCALYGAVVTLAYVVFALDAVDVVEKNLKNGLGYDDIWNYNGYTVIHIKKQAKNIHEITFFV
jgi:hypothetical protein